MFMINLRINPMYIVYKYKYGIQIFLLLQIISKYIDDSVLYDLEGIGKVKFDFRVVVMLKSVRPLTAYLHKLITPRFAEK